MTTLLTQDAGRHHRKARMAIGTAPGSARLMMVARGKAQFCIRLGEASEVGRIVGLTHMDGPRGAVLGSMVLHGTAVPIIDMAAAIGAVRQSGEDPKMFVATRTQPVVCVAFDEIVGKREQEGDQSDPGKHPHELIHEVVAIGGQSSPVIDLPAVARLAKGTARVPEKATPTAQDDQE